MTGSFESAVTFAGRSTRRSRHSSDVEVTFEKKGNLEVGPFWWGPAGPKSVALTAVPLQSSKGVIRVKRSEPLTLPA
jgi:hypothetical protein